MLDSNELVSNIANVLNEQDVQDKALELFEKEITITDEIAIFDVEEDTNTNYPVVRIESNGSKDYYQNVNNNKGQEFMVIVNIAHEFLFLNQNGKNIIDPKYKTQSGNIVEYKPKKIIIDFLKFIEEKIFKSPLCGTGVVLEETAIDASFYGQENNVIYGKLMLTFYTPFRQRRI